jgi:putative DNA primase/helicase
MSTQPQIPTPQASSAATDFIKLLFEPGDLLCLAFQNAKTQKWAQLFVTYEKSLLPETMGIIAQANDAGDNVYIAMNAYKTSSRKEVDIAAVRNVWAELDENGRANLDKIFASECVPDPTVVNESSPNKFHAIWKVKDMSVEEAKTLLKSICVEFNGDKNATDAARVLRLPGFMNCKYADRPEVEVVHLSENTSAYTASEFALVPKKATVTPIDAVSTTSRTEEQNAILIANIFAQGQTIQMGNRNSGLTSVAGALHNIGLSFSELEEQLSLYNDKFVEPPLDESEIHTIAGSIHKKPVVDPVTTFIGGKLPCEAVVESAQETTPVEEPWGEAIPMDPILSPVQKFKPEFLPESLRPLVVDTSERMGVPLDFAGICAFVTVAGVLGRRVFVYPKALDKDWKESIALSGAVVAPSGTTKTPTWKIFTNVVVEKELDWAREHSRVTESFQRELKAWEAFSKKNKGESIPPAPEEPAPARRLMLNDVTPEKMHMVMKDNPEGLFFYRDELYSWVLELEKEGREGQRNTFLAAMNGNDHCTVDRIGREAGHAIMCASIFGSFQPGRFIEFLNDNQNTDDGTVQRLSLLAWPDECNLPAIDRPANNQAALRFRKIVREAAEMNVERLSMHFDSDAQLIYNDWLQTLIQKIRAEEEEAKKSHLAKYKGMLPKIAALFQVIDLLDNGPSMGAHKIDVAHLNMAIDFVAYLESHMHRAYGCIQGTIAKAARALTRKLVAGKLKSGFTVRDVTRNDWKSLKDAKCVELALCSLQEKGWVRELFLTPSGRGGRPTVRWEINPVLPATKE